jgi:hypothetical protein
MLEVNFCNYKKAREEIRDIEGNNVYKSLSAISQEVVETVLYEIGRDSDTLEVMTGYIRNTPFDTYEETSLLALENEILRNELN